MLTPVPLAPLKTIPTLTLIQESERTCAKKNSFANRQLKFFDSRSPALSLVRQAVRPFLGLVWFGLVGFSFNASLEPQPRARRRARLAEDAPARVPCTRLSPD